LGFKIKGRNIGKIFCYGFSGYSKTIAMQQAVFPACTSLPQECRHGYVNPASGIYRLA
jgi:hypothetical protein